MTHQSIRLNVLYSTTKLKSISSANATYNLSDGQIQCYNNCKFRQSFDEQLLLDQNCIEYINSTNCYVEITFDYKERQ
ncbi:unnamed protein product, partial [Didymodactylos carnosus]